MTGRHTFSGAEDRARAVAGVAAGCLDAIALPHRLLLVDAEGDVLARALRTRGFSIVRWNRALAGADAAAPWPPAGRFGGAFVRLPKGRAELELVLHAAASVVIDDGPVVIYGANDEGIKSAAGHVEAVLADVSTLLVKSHCRVIAGRRRSTIAGLRSQLADWRQSTELVIGGVARPWTTYPGLFAGDRLDEGTALLLTCLPPFAAGARVLDFGCGTGVIAAAVRVAAPDARLTVLDHDSVALEAARENVAGARALLAAGLAPLLGETFDVVLSNPPLHQARSDDLSILRGLVRDAPRVLAPHGVLQIVVPGRVAIAEAFGPAYAEVDQPARSSRYRVLRAAAAAGVRPRTL